MTLDMQRPLPDGSYAWCSDCAWKDTTPHAHTLGKAHTEAAGHIVHVYETEQNGTTP